MKNLYSFEEAREFSNGKTIQDMIQNTKGFTIIYKDGSSLDIDTFSYAFTSYEKGERQFNKR